MVTKGKFPFALFEKSGKDKDKGMKEGSKKDMAKDKKQNFAKGGGVELKGKTKMRMC